MSNTSVHISGFSGIYTSLNGTKSFRITLLQLAWGLLTVGKTHWKQLLKTPGETLNDLIHNWTGLNTYFNTRPYLTTNQKFGRLDSSDKGNKSYNLGTAITKVIADRILKVPYLQHVDKLKAAGILTTSSGSNERGDMIGVDSSSNWHVFEAKGRTSAPSSTLKTKAKRQAQRITSINGIAPVTKNYCITHIDDISCQIYFNDPTDEQEEKVVLDTKSEELIKFYYDNIFGELYHSTPIFILSLFRSNTEFLIFDIGTSEVFLGLENNLFQSLKQNSGISEGRSERFNKFPDLEFEELAIGSDGILLLTSDFFEANKNLHRIEWDVRKAI